MSKRLGYEAPYASLAASQARRVGFDQPGLTLIIGPPVTSPGSLTAKPDVSVFYGGSEKSLDSRLSAFTDDRPEAFVVCEVDRIGQRVKDFFASLPRPE
jgi:hypothetical protein